MARGVHGMDERMGMCMRWTSAWACAWRHVGHSLVCMLLNATQLFAHACPAHASVYRLQLLGLCLPLIYARAFSPNLV
eukprot:364267-Chlamydomonas_euryale.AAC.8